MLKKLLIPTVILIFISLSAAFALTVNEPYVISFQGRLQGMQGQSSADIVFELFSNAGGSGIAVWKEDHSGSNAVSIDPATGMFNILLGNIEPLAGKMFDNADTGLWLKVTVNNTALDPLQPLTAAPYAFVAKNLKGGIVDAVSNTNVPAVTGSSDGDGVYGFSKGQFRMGVYGSSEAGKGVRGESISNWGVQGVSALESGVVGQSWNQDFTNAKEIVSTAFGPLLIIRGGVAGRGRGFAGVAGYSEKNYGVYGFTEGDFMVGVYGSSEAGKGVRGDSISDWGVQGVSALESGIYGSSNNSTFTKALDVVSTQFGPMTVTKGGVVGRGDGFAGVTGYSLKNYGVYGESKEYPGVFGSSKQSAGVAGARPTDATGADPAISGFNDRDTAGDNPGVKGYSKWGYGVHASVGRSGAKGGVYSYGYGGYGVEAENNSTDDATIYAKNRNAAGTVLQLDEGRINIREDWTTEPSHWTDNTGPEHRVVYIHSAVGTVIVEINLSTVTVYNDYVDKDSLIFLTTRCYAEFTGGSDNVGYAKIIKQGDGYFKFKISTASSGYARIVYFLVINRQTGPVVDEG